ncbi:hypothetical protein INH39_32590 [Massilia violaceinigra]|uniref:Uncharacterized protein n=1 Tax=Massilia violaceinigra TaxID=2045208 RepID=A0ABY4A5I4_9BURK|nr:hypothetical protein [Massilia violaceinigra]UOD30033.1 hypothetical protein INH39_32590 [Massilia violaceinigra]
MKIALLLVLVAVIVGGVLFTRVYKENRRSIDCGMQASIVAGIALRRDKGATRDEVRAAMSGTDLKNRSSAQIESMLDAVYVHGIGKSFEEIRNIAWEQCDKHPER